MAKIGDVLGGRRLVAKDWNCNIWQRIEKEQSPDEFLVEFGTCAHFWLSSDGIVRLMGVLAATLRAAGFRAIDPAGTMLDRSGNNNHLVIGTMAEKQPNKGKKD